MEQFAYAIALTGGIATGKSTVSVCFETYGFKIIDADKVAHKILDSQAESVSEMFGTQYLTEGKVDRQALGRLVFSDDAHRKRLESLLHPRIRKEIAQQAAELEREQKPYLIDIPLFFESGEYAIKEVIVVYVPREIQIARLMQRNGYSMQEAKMRLASQMDIEEKRNKATYVIDNSGDRDQLERECQRVSNLILAKNRL